VIRLAVRVRRERAELALAELLELAPGGVEETDLGDAIEYAVYGAPGELPELPDLRAAAGDDLVDVTTREVPDDWADRWKQFHTPIVVAGRLRVRPPWAEAEEGLLDVVIDPGRAFGTGAHATTRLCLELLAGLEPRGPLLDVGCGSGVLAIAAAKLGFGPVRGVDHEVESVDATRENARVNGVEVEAARADLRRDPLAWAPTVTANLLRPLLLELSARLPDPLPSTLIASGLLCHEADEVAAAFAAGGLHEAARRESGEWAALLLTRRD
jgi:ribosomal protein L11 methyltransferase